MHLGVYCNLFWVLFSAVVCQQAYRLQLGTLTKPGSGLFPFVLGLAMLVLAVVALVGSLRRRPAPREEGGEPREPFRWWNIVLILAALVAYALTLETVGFLLNTFLFIGLLLKIVEPRPWPTALAGGAITAVVAEVLFNVVFRAQIPTGILGF